MHLEKRVFVIFLQWPTFWDFNNTGLSNYIPSGIRICFPLLWRIFFQLGPSPIKQCRFMFLRGSVSLQNKPQTFTWTFLAQYLSNFAITQLFQIFAFIMMQFRKNISIFWAVTCSARKMQRCVSNFIKSSEWLERREEMKQYNKTELNQLTIDHIQQCKMQEILNPFHLLNYHILKSFSNFEHTSSKNFPFFNYSLLLQTKIQLIMCETSVNRISFFLQCWMLYTESHNKTHLAQYYGLL